MARLSQGWVNFWGTGHVARFTGTLSGEQVITRIAVDLGIAEFSFATGSIRPTSTRESMKGSRPVSVPTWYVSGKKAL